MLDIQLFGTPTIKEDGQFLIIKRRTTRALLFYVAALQKPISRDILVEFFWPDKPEDKARHTLADNLSKLGAELKDKTILDVTPTTVALNLKSVNVDWAEFCDLMAQINKTPGAFAPNSTLSASLYQKMSAAVLLWNSRTLIENDEVALSSVLEQWLDDLRYECSSFLKRVLPRLAQHETLTGNHNLAIHWLGLARKFDEYDEDINKAMIEAFLQANRHAEARALFNQIKDLYADDAGDEIPANLLALEPRLNPSYSSTSVEERTNIRVLSGLSFPFIGQKKALANLTLYCQRNGNVIVFGDGGSGKTRLVYEFCRLHGADKKLLVTSCQPLEIGMPFAPWISLLRNSITTEEWKKLDQNWAGVLTLLLPELPTLRKNLPDSPTGRKEMPRTVLLEAVYQLLRTLAEKRPIIIFLDDAHWADESSLALLSYLHQKSFFGPGKNILIMAARTEETSTLLNEFLLSILPVPIPRVNTQLFNLEELSELCYFIFSRNATLPFLEKLHADTGGNAFFSNQILHAMLEQNPGVDLEQVETLPMPDAIKDAIQRKFLALSHPAQEVISTASVMGREFEIQMLESANSLTTEEYMLALEELEQARIIQPVREGEAVYSFVHEKLREGLQQFLNPSRKRLLHRRVAHALEIIDAGNTGQASLLAYHFEQAGLYNKAFEAWLQAAQHAWRLMAISDAMDACHRAEQLIRYATGSGDEQIYTIYRLWGQIAYENDDQETLKKINLSLYQLGKERNNNLLIGSALTGLSDTEMAGNRYEKSLEYVEKAIIYVQRSESPYEQARALNRRGVATYMLGRLREAQSYFMEALDLTHGTQTEDLIHEQCISLNRMGVVETLLGYPWQAVEHAKLALALGEKIQNTYEQISANNVMSLAYYLMVDYDHGYEAAQRGIELARRVETWRLYGYLCSYGSLSALELGNAGEAWKLAHKAIEIGQLREHDEIVGLGCRALGDLMRHLGALEKARDAYTEGMIAAGKHFTALENMIRLGFVEVMLGNETEKESVVWAVNSAIKLELGAISVPGATLELALHLMTMDKDSFEARLPWLKDQMIEKFGKDVSGLYINRIQAEIAFAEQRYQDAYDAAKPAMDWYHQIENLWYELNMAWIMEKSAQNLNVAHKSLRPRINELLSKVEATLLDAPLQDEWKAFQIKYSS